MAATPARAPFLFVTALLVLMLSPALAQERCGDADCGDAESAYSCPTDCPASGIDLFCNGARDSACDPDCGSRDPDCAAKGDANEEARSLFSSASGGGAAKTVLFLMLLLMLSVIIIALLRRIRRQGQSGTPPGIGPTSLTSHLR